MKIDPETKDLLLIAKTIMRKKDFKTPSNIVYNLKPLHTYYNILNF